MKFTALQEKVGLLPADAPIEKVRKLAVIVDKSDDPMKAELMEIMVNRFGLKVLEALRGQ